MLYQISRNGQMYGPYTLEDLQRYVASGNIALTDLAKSEEMADWVPVSQILTPPVEGASAPPAWAPPAPAYPPAYQQPVAAIHPNQYPDPPTLNWGLVLLFTILSCGLFWYVWIIVQAIWLRRVQPTTNALFYWIGLIVLGLVRTAISIPASFHPTVARHGAFFVYTEHPILGVLGLAGVVVYCLAAFTTRAALEEHFNGPEPIGLRLSGVMTFFFSILYFQYHLTRLAEIKRMVRYQAPR